MCRYFDENSWKLDCVQKAETVRELSTLVSEQVLAQVFDMFCDPMTGGQADEFSLNKARVSRSVNGQMNGEKNSNLIFARFYGDFLLAANSGYVLSEFMEMWQKVI